MQGGQSTAARDLLAGAVPGFPETCSLVPFLGFHAPALDGCIQRQNQRTEPSSQLKGRRAL